MSIFGKKKAELPPLISDAELAEFDEPAVNYNSVVEWLVGLGEDDLAKVNKVVEINRKAYADTCGVLGLNVTASSFITPPEPAEPEASATDEPEFLMDDIAPKSKSKGRKVTVKSGKIKQLWADWQAERSRSRDINAKLEALIDPTFLDRALKG